MSEPWRWDGTRQLDGEDSNDKLDAFATMEPVKTGITNVTWMPGSRPRAFFFKGSYKRTYIVYCAYNVPAGSSTMYITYYDHDDHIMATPISLGTISPEEFHTSPTVVVDSLGYIHVFYAQHQQYLYYLRSINPEDISNWTPRANLTNYIGDGDTPAGYQYVVIYPNDHILVFFQAGPGIGDVTPRFKFIKTIDRGATWQNAVTVVNWTTQRVYGYFGFKDGRIDFAFTIQNTGTTVAHDIYYAYSTDEGASWKRINGTAITLPMTSSNMTLANFGKAVDVVDTDGIQLQNVDHDETGRAYLWYKHVVNPSSPTNRYEYLLRWAGSAWSSELMGDFDAYLGEVKVWSRKRVEIYLETDSDIIRWVWTGAYFSLKTQVVYDGAVGSAGNYGFFLWDAGRFLIAYIFFIGAGAGVNGALGILVLTVENVIP